MSRRRQVKDEFVIADDRRCKRFLRAHVFPQFEYVILFGSETSRLLLRHVQEDIKTYLYPLQIVAPPTLPFSDGVDRRRTAAITKGG